MTRVTIVNNIMLREFIIEQSILKSKKIIYYDFTIRFYEKAIQKMKISENLL